MCVGQRLHALTEWFLKPPSAHQQPHIRFLDFLCSCSLDLVFCWCYFVFIGPGVFLVLFWPPFLSFLTRSAAPHPPCCEWWVGSCVCWTTVSSSSGSMCLTLFLASRCWFGPPLAAPGSPCVKYERGHFKFDIGFCKSPISIWCPW